MYDFEIAFYLYKMSKVQNIFLDSQYKAKAYYSAALALDAYNTYIEKVYNQKQLRTLPFVGDKIEKCIIEIIETGRLAELDDYEQRFDIEDYTLLLSHGLPDLLIKKLWGLSVHSAYTLLDNRQMERIRGSLTKGEQVKTVDFLENFRMNEGEYLFAYGDCLAEALSGFLETVKGVGDVKTCGELDSVCEKIRRIELQFSYCGRWDYLMRKIRTYSGIREVRGKEYKEITGSTAFGIPFVLSVTGQSTPALDTSHECLIKGDLHSHTLWTDGIHSIEQMAQEAVDRHYEYFAVTDHSYSMKIAHGLSETQAISQIYEIHEMNKNYPIRILAGIEADILSDGSLDYSDEVLRQFDFVIAAIHSHLNQPPMVLLSRLERALSNQYVNILAHPTGRLLGRPGVLFCERKPYDLDIQYIIELCKKNNVVLEVNCFPERLDLNIENIALASEHGVKVSLGTDAHSLAHLRNMDYGIKMLAKAGISSDMVLNTYSCVKLLDFFNNQRGRRVPAQADTAHLRTKDFDYYFGGNPEIIHGEKSIIGIDLTGSEEKESGWAYMKASHVICRRVASDRDIIESVERLRPDVVSIDSPLAYPKGRCCSRKDCECAKYGIMRQSERMLRHFGITVYPCLIDSMVNLTTRGMKLAGILRNKGYTVIESYPGVAQDVLMIPRKGKTTEQFAHLKQGLSSFGITGDLVENPAISHDEVDAVTSALVGYFFLNGQYVGLGNEDEDYLIVPRIQDELLQKRIIVGLSGETGAGKTTAAEYLKFKYGLKYFRYSKVIAQMYHVEDKGALQKIGAQIAAEPEKQRELSRYMIGMMDSVSSYVIDGLRHPEDYEELKSYFGKDFMFIYVDCRYSNRYKRYNKLYFDKISQEHFKVINDHKSEWDILHLQQNADYCIDNNAGFKDLRMHIDNIVKKESGGTV